MEQSLTNVKKSENTAGEFEPKIIAFVCNWCTYSAADLAGTARIQVPNERKDGKG